MHDVLLHRTECHHREQMASAATMLWHSILQNDMSLLSGKRYWFLSMFPVCSMASVTTTTLHVKYTEEMHVCPRVLSAVGPALCPAKSTNALTPLLDFCSLKRNLDISPLLLVKGFKMWETTAYGVGQVVQGMVSESEKKGQTPALPRTTKLSPESHHLPGLLFPPWQRERGTLNYF